MKRNTGQKMSPEGQSAPINAQQAEALKRRWKEIILSRAKFHDHHPDDDAMTRLVANAQRLRWVQVIGNALFMITDLAREQLTPTGQWTATSEVRLQEIFKDG